MKIMQSTVLFVSSLTCLFAFEFCTQLGVLNCVEVNACSELTDTHTKFTKGVWFHQSNTSLWTAEHHEFMASLQNLTFAHALHAIVRIEPELGVVIRICEPDFSVLRSQNRYVCNDKTIQNIQCASTCSPVTLNNSRMQMVQFDFLPEWGCFDSSDVSNGIFLSPLTTTTPNRKELCPKPTHSTYVFCPSENVSCCDFECDTDYVREHDTCIHQCGQNYEAQCQHFQHTLQTCTTSDKTLFMCQNCSALPGSEIVAWNLRSNRSVCEYKSCDAGYFSSGSSCVQCAKGTYSARDASECIECEYGKTSAEDFSTCTECFDAQTHIDNLCLSGQQFTQNFSRTASYLDKYAPSNTSKFLLMKSFCMQEYACLPCPPGTYLTNNACELCPKGQYQPNFQSTHCYSCNANQTTHFDGAKSSTECRCEPGFEE